MDVVSNAKGQMSGVQLKRTDTGEESVLQVKGLFYGIGHTPNSQLLQGQIELDSTGYILVKEGSAKTSVDGVFAAGDVQVTLSFIFCMELLHSLKGSLGAEAKLLSCDLTGSSPGNSLLQKCREMLRTKTQSRRTLPGPCTSGSYVHRAAPMELLHSLQCIFFSEAWIKSCCS